MVEVSAVFDTLPWGSSSSDTSHDSYKATVEWRGRLAATNRVVAKTLVYGAEDGDSDYSGLGSDYNSVGVAVYPGSTSRTPVPVSVTSSNEAFSLWVAVSDAIGRSSPSSVKGYYAVSVYAIPTNINELVGEIRGNLILDADYSPPLVTTLTGTNVTLIPNTVHYENIESNTTYNFEFDTAAYASGKANFVALQVDVVSTNGVTWSWPADPAVLVWHTNGGTNPVPQTGRNYLYFDRIRDVDPWRGFSRYCVHTALSFCSQPSGRSGMINRPRWGR
jgi:hypothetical protein